MQQSLSTPFGLLSFPSFRLLRVPARNSVRTPEAWRGGFASTGVSSSVNFESREATIDTVHHALFSGKVSCREVVSSFIARIEAYNPKINAVVNLNAHALEYADEMDELLRMQRKPTEPLFCVPILLKDNYDTFDVKTSGSCRALKDSQPTTDAPSVKALRDVGAIILGKVNLHELALEGLSVSSYGGQTLNPYDLNRTPGGSSGGTGAAISASFAVFGTGTDTVNSLRSPASANSLFSVRPTRGLISRAGIIPVSYTQDTIGSIARSLKDVATALTVMAKIGYDPKDNVTALVPPSVVGVDYTKALYGGSLEGVRFGLIEGFFNRTVGPETTPVNKVMDSVVSKLQAAGATVITIKEQIYNSSAIANDLDVQRFEFRELMDSYLSDESLGGSHPTSLAELYASADYLVIPSQYSYVNTALISSTSNETYAAKQRGIQNLKLALQTTFKIHSLDALIYPEQQNLVVKRGSASQFGRNGILGALTGSPVVTVPAGFSQPSKGAPDGVPIGMEILGPPWSERKLLNIASQIGDLGQVRRMPRLVSQPVPTKEYASVPEIVPNTEDIPKEYLIAYLGDK
ncbi:hypothetical protein AJ79_09668 [Helicocarpus griseus UAMH5409]|uniref:Amidase domain-containing protein n=1 Tax=Helicocarpus griseus UAMH5409 TaxID=1447875 RepID=A0A2B7WHZ2_9EURO|nr:hypothetical protein AJ79_09668 [Helicocarpus griseus UAMH5409]